MPVTLLNSDPVLRATSELSYPAFNDAVLGGTAQGEILGAAAEAVEAAVAIEPALVLGAGLAGFAAGQYIMKKLNPDFVVPPIGRRFTGGQQDGRQYVVNYTATSPEFGTQTANVSVTGPVGNAVVTTYKGSSGETLHEAYIPCKFGPFGQVGKASILTNTTDQTTLVVNSVTPSDGNQDLNRNLQQDFPINPQLLSPLVFPRPLTLPDGSTLDLNPQVLPSTRNDENLEPNRLTSPGILVNVPEAGQMINFTPSGVQIIPYQQNTQQLGLQQRLLTIPTLPPKLTTECECPPCDTTELLCRIKRLESELLSDGYDYASHPTPALQGNMVTSLPDELYSVTLSVVQTVQNAKKQRGEGGSPDVLYAGWFSFILEDGQLTREPVDYATKAYIAPSGSTGYSYTVYDGYLATTIAHTRKRKDYIDDC